MVPTKAMIIAARRAEYDFYQREPETRRRSVHRHPGRGDHGHAGRSAEAGSCGRTTCRTIGSDDPTSRRVTGLNHHQDKVKAAAMIPAARMVFGGMWCGITGRPRERERAISGGHAGTAPGRGVVTKQREGINANRIQAWRVAAIPRPHNRIREDYVHGGTNRQ